MKNTGTDAGSSAVDDLADRMQSQALNDGAASSRNDGSTSTRPNTRGSRAGGRGAARRGRTAYQGVYRPPGALREQHQQQQQHSQQHRQQQPPPQLQQSQPPPVQQQQQQQRNLSNNPKGSPVFAQKPAQPSVASSSKAQTSNLDLEYLIDALEDGSHVSYSEIADTLRQLLMSEDDNNNDVKEDSDESDEDEDKVESILDAFIKHLFKSIAKFGTKTTDQAVYVSVYLADMPRYQAEFSRAIGVSADQYIYTADFPANRRTMACARNLCELMGKLIVADWPRQYRSPDERVNSILNVCVETLATWCVTVQQEIANETNASFINGLCRCILLVTHTAGRDFWLCWPDEIDRLWAAIQTIICAKVSVLEVDVKKDLLNMFVLLHTWPKQGRPQRAIQMETKETQTNEDEFLS